LTATVHVRNRQRTAPIQARYLREIARTVLDRVAPGLPGDLGIFLVGEREIIRLNEQFLRHAGPTDVITFDYQNKSRGGIARRILHAEIFICVAEAKLQSRRFGVRWPDEVVRCVIHGLLHLTGHDDAQPGRRRRMKQEENRLLKEMAWRFPWQRTALKPRSG
jgi:probable rRNA maturation factor